MLIAGPLRLRGVDGACPERSSPAPSGYAPGLRRRSAGERDAVASELENDGTAHLLRPARAFGRLGRPPPVSGRDGRSHGRTSWSAMWAVEVDPDVQGLITAELVSKPIP